MGKFAFILLLAALLTGGLLQAQERTGKRKQPPNILFIAVDDLRAELGCYGNEYIVSPNLDRLAGEGVLFRNHYVVVPTCGPSRYSLLTGRRPRTGGELSNSVFESRQKRGGSGPGPESFVEQLKLQGYYTIGIGKISHSPDGYIYGYTETPGREMELPGSWNEMLLDAEKWGSGWNAFFGYADGTNRNTLKGQVPPYESGAVADEGYPDGLSARLAIEKLRERAASGQPFFMGLGFFKPHLPFNAPKRYWDLYEGKEIPLSPVPFLPEGVNPESLHESAEFNQYSKGEEKASLERALSEAYARKVRRAYFAGISYIDAQIGKVLAELKRLGLDKNTIVVVWGDHGWHLGDQLVWGKHTLSEWALRSTLIVKAPGRKKGGVSEKVVSSVDLYPTLMELCGIRGPQGLDGKSFAPLLSRPDDRAWENFAYSYFKRGISLRTENYRLTRYFRPEKPDLELYDYRDDPFESRNVAAEKKAEVEKLMPLLEAGDTGLYAPREKP